MWVYDASKMVASPSPVQKFAGVRAIYGMLWDQQSQTLWAVGKTDAADGSGGEAMGIVQGYKYDQSSNKLSESKGFTMSSAERLDAEWKGQPFEKWWDGPHDLVPVPSSRTLLISTDRDLHAINLDTGEFNDSGEQLVQQHLRGFRPLGDRTADDGQTLPRSDIKSISLRQDGSVPYTQAPWMDESGLASQVNSLSPSGDFPPFSRGRHSIGHVGLKKFPAGLQLSQRSPNKDDGGSLGVQRI